MVDSQSAVLKRSYRCWSIHMTGDGIGSLVAEGPWCFIGEAQTLLQRLNRMSAADVTRFVEGPDLAAYLMEHMRRGPGKNKRDRRCIIW